MICNEDHRFIVAEQFREINTDPQAIILEPVGRNTAPAIAVAALQAISLGKDPLLLILAADHLIEDTVEFQRVIQSAKIYANQGSLVTFGIIPTSAETGYGYIEAKESAHQKDKITGLEIRNFIEKQNKDKAETKTFDQPHGSLMLMQGATQSAWKHGIRKSKKISEPRINFTFRNIITQ